jgi:toxin ParE1/3/4
MAYTVSLTENARRDLEEIYDYIAEHDSHVHADYVLDKIEEALGSLSSFPARGAYPKELLAIGIRDYREVFFKPYRLIYRVIGKTVYVYLIADGRRDMQALLVRHLLNS